MQEEREISIIAAIYTMIKRWRVMFIVAILVFVAGYGFLLYKENKVTVKDDSATAVAEAVTEADIAQAKKDVEEVKKYVENSAYMELDPTDSHYHIISYLINWKDSGLSGDTLENKSATLYGFMVNYVPSEDFIKKIENYKPGYRGKFLHRLISMGRSGNEVTFSILYSGDKYLPDLCDIIKTILKEKEEQYKPFMGDFEFILVDESIREADTNTIKNEQKAQKDGLKTMDTNAKNMKVTEKPADSAKVIWLGFRKTVVIVFIGIFCGLAVGFLIVVFGKKFNSVDDILELPSREVICVYKQELETRIDRMFYKKSDRYQNPERYLSILEKNMEDAGLKKLYLYNCSDTDLSEIEGKVSAAMSNITVCPVAEEEKDSFYLNMKEDEAVVILAKGGDTRRDALSRIEEHLRAVGVKCLGEIFAV